MKAKPGFVLRQVVGEQMLMPTGENTGSFAGAVLLNAVSAFVWEELQHEVTRDQLLDSLLARYDIGRETAARDLDALLARFAELGILEADEPERE